MNSRRSLFIAAFLVVIALAASVATAKDEWIRVRSKNFHLIGNADEKAIRQVATKLEQFRETFRLLFPGMKIVSPIETNVIVFKNASAYKPYKPKRADGKSDEWVAGYFQAGEDVNYITLSTEGEKEDTYGTIFHEYVHYMLNTSFGKARVPPWFNEGLAEYYQTYQIVDDQKVTLGFVQNIHLQLLRQTKLIPLKQFFEVDNYSLHASGGHSRSIFYAQAWALIHYLIQGNKGSNVKGLEKFIALILRDVEPETAFSQAFNSDYSAMEKELRKYVEDGKYTATLFTLKEKLVFDAQMTVTPLGDAETNAYLGDLLLHTGEFADAETHLNKALALRPGLTSARISLGLVKMRQRNFAEAKKHLEEALVEDKTNHFAHYNYAFILSRESVDEFGMVRNYPPETLSKMRSSLLKAIEINPQYGESYRLLGFVSLVSGDDLDEALRVVNKGLAIQPGNPDYLLLTAKILMRQEKFANARAVAEQVARSTEKKDVRAEADGLINSIKQIEETKAAYEKQMKDAMAAIESQGGKAQIFGSQPPVILKRKDLSDAEVEQIEKDRNLRNLNRLLDPLVPGESRVVGRIHKVACVKGEVVFNVESQGTSLHLSSKDFQSMQMSVLKEGTQNFEVGCDADLSKELVVVTYRPEPKPKANLAGVIASLAFVPDDFRLMTADELAKSRTVIIEGGPPTNLSKNSEIVAAEQAEFERRRKEAIIRQIQNALRQPEPGETRIVGNVEKIECSGQTMSVNIASASGPVKLKVINPRDLRLGAFTPDAAGLQFGCGASMPGLKAIITYLPSTEKKPKFAGDLKAVEFVPAGFELAVSP